jgi:DNA-binding HxlR family transcriptional regulator
MAKMEKLDGQILALLLVKGQKMRFNELHDALGEGDVEISKPTLSLHLKGLEQKKYVIRKVEDVQNVSYRINLKEAVYSKGFVETIIKENKRLKEDKEYLYSLPVEEQVKEVLRNAGMISLSQLEVWISYLLNRKDGKERFGDMVMLMMLDSPAFHWAEKWVINKCISDENYRNNVLEAIKGLANKIEIKEEED